MAGETGAADGPGRRSRRGERLFGAPADPGTPRPERERPAAPPALRRAALVVAVEALGLVGVAVVLVYLILTSTPTSTSAAVGEVVFVLLAATALGVTAAGLWRAAGWARAPVIVLQLLLGLVGYTIAFEAERPLIGLPVLALVAVELYLLATPEARLAYFDR
ncbi:hypothetical protein GB931_18655 [Modestobacter sp. I12A-02628]|uniref:Uncharacterized protein n=1 Tax=Goekera deserti TaxID=2497753 RepID=A0A7K3W7M2_9ACTN|nr:hypothetical protein [Goekera deserti]MPQ99900.1 hypothetical protein [Goekera deserti]NDI50059.1 hypothetical protein [Goekera deserti]NEL52465.1 hypothetical protein [Goekera deserti]